ncbi:MAG TPA: hypothetical protein VN721_08950 [Flavipsychrobacter sp.]|nr:hypothetical protein [Flavipsychrobacter sp.]
MKKTFFIPLVYQDVPVHTGNGFFTVPERTVFSYRYTSFWVRR